MTNILEVSSSGQKHTLPMISRSGTSIQKTFHTKSVTSECRNLARSVIDFLHQVTSDQDLHFELELIITEACFNVVVHGYNHDSDGDIKARVVVNEHNWLYMEFEDWGRPFTGPDQDVFKLDPNMESGRGIYIISQLSDKLSYEHTMGKNILRIEKNLARCSGV